MSFYEPPAGRLPRPAGFVAIVDSLVAAHHGRVEVRTAPDVSATFRILLPLHD
ncbi:hypothetical protein [Streptomyces sp. NPDC021212]|uniref:hypothetical protein n=1 Tax=Streptomyces sp. NPDC021212 TaxID=3365118 RepID=UPI0037A7160D